MPDDPHAPKLFGVTRKLYRKWRSPRFGCSNPEVMTNPVWEWLIHSKLNPYLADEHFPDSWFSKKISSFDSGPGWCFDRFGQSSTRLADGRTVLIAGEHEDYYDPDFNIYNDVIVKNPDGSLDIYGYPKDLFPPTDFHSATLLGNEILIVGNLGYPDVRQENKTQVFVLQLEDFSITARETFGAPPCWIHSHKMTLSDDGQSLLLTGGKLHLGEKIGLVENIDEWRLDLTDWHWHRLTDRQWPRWKVLRSDGEMNHLWIIENQAIKKQAGLDYPEHEFTKELLTSLGEIDYELFAQLFRPEIPHEAVPESTFSHVNLEADDREDDEEKDDEFGVTRIIVDGIVVRYARENNEIQVTVEGELPPTTIEILKQDLLEKLQTLEKTACEIQPIL